MAVNASRVLRAGSAHLQRAVLEPHAGLPPNASICLIVPHGQRGVGVERHDLGHRRAEVLGKKIGQKGYARAGIEDAVRRMRTHPRRRLAK